MNKERKLLIMIAQPLFTGHRRLKKSYETFKKANEADLTSFKEKLESATELLLSKISAVESRSHDYAAQLDQIRSNISRKTSILLIFLHFYLLSRSSGLG